jgi:hypothetical protein
MSAAWATAAMKADAATHMQSGVLIGKGPSETLLLV